MPADTERFAAPNHQARFHARWGTLTDPHVRTLAWLLDAPNLLDAAAPQWQGRIASIDDIDDDLHQWLADLDRAPARLHDFLGLHPLMRLGRYAEKLMAFYLEHAGRLYAHGVQIRNEKNETIGEFDFLLRHGQTLVHWEFATKLYLLEPGGQGHHADYFVGPNLADTLGAKVRKIMDRQLSLSQHPAAQGVFPYPIVSAQALVKGWLFYQGTSSEALHPRGISFAHCRGFWCSAEDRMRCAMERYLLLPRLSWLTPALSSGEQLLEDGALDAALAAHFEATRSPALVAVMKELGGQWIERDRGFIVPADWRHRAGLRVKGEERSGV